MTTEDEIRYLDDLIERYQELGSIKDELLKAYQIMENTYLNGKKMLIAGNGGSASDSEHITGELMKCFEKKRTVPYDFASRLIEVDTLRGQSLASKLEGALPAISLVSHQSIMSAYLNDVGAEGVYAQQLYGYGTAGDTFLAISTSGNSENIIYAAVVAKAMGINVIALTGRDGGILKQYADCCVIVPEDITYKIQELHQPIYHCWCRMLENRFWGNREA